MSKAEKKAIKNIERRLDSTNRLVMRIIEQKAIANIQTENHSFDEILKTIVNACDNNFPDGDFNKRTTILECATKIYIAQMTGGNVI